MKMYLTACILALMIPQTGFCPTKEVLATIKEEVAEKAYYVNEIGLICRDLGTRIITGYSSTVDQCDDTPFITASNKQVGWGIIATNEFPFGSVVKIDDLGFFVVEDRTNKRYNYRVDIWFPSREMALNWGNQTRNIAICE